MVFFGCRRAVCFSLFGVRMACSYRFIHSSCRRFYAAKGSWATERSVSGYLAKGKRKAPLGLPVGGLFAYRHTPEGLRSRTPWNKSSAYVLYTHYKSEIFKSVILSVLYHIRHFDVFVVKRKTLTFVKVYRLWDVVDNYHFVVIQLNFFYEIIYEL